MLITGFYLKMETISDYYIYIYRYIYNTHKIYIYIGK